MIASKLKHLENMVFSPGLLCRWVVCSGRHSSSFMARLCPLNTMESSLLPPLSIEISCLCSEQMEI